MTIRGATSSACDEYAKAVNPTPSPEARPLRRGLSSCRKRWQRPITRRPLSFTGPRLITATSETKDVLRIRTAVLLAKLPGTPCEQARLLIMGRSRPITGATAEPIGNAQQ
jgi:hypothetical protein